MKLHHAASMLVVLAACAPKADAPPAATPPQVVTFTATDFAFAGPDTIAPGLTAINFVNKGSQEHHLILGRLDDGKTVADLMAAMQKNPNADPGFIKFLGAAGAVATGDSTGSTEDLTPGNYVAICFIPDPADGKAHVEKGMMKTIVVAGTAVTATAPTADVEMKLADFSFTDTPALTAGTHTVHIVNNGPQTHEAQLVRLDDGADMKSFMAALAPGAKAPPPGKAVGGSGALSPGKDNYWTVTLSAGKYLFMCMVPDSASGQPHMMKGMIREFTIQ